MLFPLLLLLSLVQMGELFAAFLSYPLCYNRWMDELLEEDEDFLNI
jgi:hypothetical protein